MPDGEDPDDSDQPPDEGAEGSPAESGEGPPAGVGIDVGDPEHEEIAAKAAADPDAFLTMMSHFYRGAVSQSMKWRDRLDRTVHWSIIIVASLLTWSFSSPNRPHVILLLGVVIVSVFLWIEARRYLYFDVWRSQARIIEENVFAHALEPSYVEVDEWRSRLSQDLRHPAFKITMMEALARRLQRVYLALLTILFAAWLTRVVMQSPTLGDVPVVAGVGPVPGWLVLVVVLALWLLLVGIVLWPREREAKGHVHDRDEAVDLRDEP